MNVFEFAMKMELDGKTFYEKLARESAIEGLSTIFRRLARDEQKHYEVFQNLKTQTQSTAMEDSTALEEARNIFEGLLTGKDALGPLGGDLDGYREAMRIEAESVRLYEEAAKKEKDDDVRVLLSKIAREEEKHFNIVQNIYDFVRAPNQYLAWAEFSNLGEFRQFGRDVDL